MIGKGTETEKVGLVEGCAKISCFGTNWPYQQIPWGNQLSRPRIKAPRNTLHSWSYVKHSPMVEGGMTIATFVQTTAQMGGCDKIDHDQ
jgi:hypothetical protein